MGRHLMIDLETWGTGPNALPVSIGAVKFEATIPVSLEPYDPGMDEDGSAKPLLMDCFHVGIVPESCEPFGFEKDASTLMWWLDEQRAEARREWLALEKHDIGTVLAAFMTWLNTTSPDEYQVWGNGATFDNVIMNNVFAKVLGPGTKPWGFRQDRCYRTVNSIFNDQVGQLNVPMFGTTHNALVDAAFQARRLQLIYERLGWAL